MATNDIKALEQASQSAVYKSFSGANIYATIGHRPVATLQSVTVSITREVAALYSFGDANPKSFVRGKRGIAGTLVFTQYDRHALLQDIFADAYGQSLASSQSDFGTQFANLNPSTGGSLLGQDYIPTRQFGNPSTFANALGLTSTDTHGSLAEELSTLYDLVASTKLRYTDQIPEFDIHITLINENGDAAFCAIGGVLLVNEGWGYTLDDLTSESAFTYVARSITPLTSLTDPNTQGVNSRTSFASKMTG